MPTRSKAPTRTPAAKPDALTAFFADPANKRLNTADYVARGVEHVTDDIVARLQARLEAVRERILKITDSDLLKLRLELLAAFLDETTDQPETPARREAAFALAYFFEGSDRIPDGTPRYGLLDDALVVAAVLERSEAALRTHWQRLGRAWPEPV